MRLFKRNKGEGYIDVCLLTLFLSVCSCFLIATCNCMFIKADLMTKADTLIDCVSGEGMVSNKNIEKYVSKYKSEGIRVYISSEKGKNQVQFGEAITVRLEYDVYFGVGEIGKMITLQYQSQGISRKYWK